jgi:adenosylmethionine-8-amino-7-oxononanoate aminotransferase
VVLHNTGYTGSSISARAAQANADIGARSQALRQQKIEEDNQRKKIERVRL